MRGERVPTRERFPKEVEACEELVGVAWRMLGTRPWLGRPMTDAPADRLIASEAARGLKTYRASLEASLGGYGPQAAMLDRTLFEGMAVAYWVRANPELAGKRFEQHSRHLRGLWTKRLEAHEMDADIADVPDAEEQRELDKLFGKWGAKLWCGLAMNELVESIEDQWEAGERRREMKGFFASPTRTTRRRCIRPRCRCPAFPGTFRGIEAAVPLCGCAQAGLSTSGTAHRFAVDAL
jgi:uncharacterized protein DUF5677